MNIIFINLNINVRIIKICVDLNMIFYNIFDDNKSNYKLLNMFKNVVDNNNKRINFRIYKIK